jgi:hypothetical protein
MRNELFTRTAYSFSGRLRASFTFMECLITILRPYLEQSYSEIVTYVLYSSRAARHYQVTDWRWLLPGCAVWRGLLE